MSKKQKIIDEKQRVIEEMDGRLKFAVDVAAEEIQARALAEIAPPIGSPVKVVKVYRGGDGWRWRAMSGNHKTVADSGEAYIRRVDCVRVAERVFGAGVVEVEA